MASKSHYNFKGFGDFAEWVDFVCWWSCIGKGLLAACETGLCSHNKLGKGKPLFKEASITVVYFLTTSYYTDLHI